MQLTPDPAESAAKYGYFVLQARSDPEGVTGVLENLSTGEKRRFQSSEELLTFLRRWAERREAPP